MDSSVYFGKDGFWTPGVARGGWESRSRRACNPHADPGVGTLGAGWKGFKEVARGVPVASSSIKIRLRVHEY